MVKLCPHTKFQLPRWFKSDLTLSPPPTQIGLRNLWVLKLVLDSPFSLVNLCPHTKMQLPRWCILPPTPTPDTDMPRSMIRVEGYCHGVKKFITFFLKIQFLQMMSYMRPRILPKKNMYHLWVKKNFGGAFGGSECWKMLKNGIFSFPTKIEWLKEVPEFPFKGKMSTSCVYFIHNWPTYNWLI